MEKKNFFLLNNETDKLQMRNKIIDRINNQINIFFEDNQNLENVLNIKGTWGTGKTTIVNHLEEYFNQRFTNKNDINFYIINLWEYETTLNPYNSLLKDILYKIIKKDDLDLYEPEKSKNKVIAKWYANLSFQIPLISLLGLKVKFGTEIEGNKEKNLDALKDKKSLDELNEEAIKEIKNFIDQEKIKIVFIFDEIDRCILENQIKFLSYIKNIFFKITNIFFIVACNNEYIDSNLSMSNNYLESYTCKLFNKTIDLNLIIPTYRGFFTKNDFINRFIKEISNDKRNILSPREINDWLEKISIVFLSLEKEYKKSLTINNQEISIYQKLKDKIDFIIFFCFYIKNKEKDYYSEIISNEAENIMTLNSFDLLFNFLFKMTKNFNPLYELNKEQLNHRINTNSWDEHYATKSIFVGWKDAERNEYSFHMFSLLPFIWPIISKTNIHDLFEKKIAKRHYMTEVRRVNQPHFEDEQYLNILFDCETEILPLYAKLFLNIIWENAKNKINVSPFNPSIIKLAMDNFNYKNIFNIIENTIFY